MGYGNKVKFHYDIPIFIKEQLSECAKKLGLTATNLLTMIIEEAYKKEMEEK